MDPVSQAVLGAAAAQAVLSRRGRADPAKPLGREAWWLGALGGMAPDLDVVIRSANDPLLALEMHRHFTHSLAFIPIGGLLVAAPFLLRARAKPREHKLRIVAATTLGWATHGLLDAFTSYGTMLWWPFSRARVAIDWVSVIDPIYTVILAIGVGWAAWSLTRRPAIVALLLSSLYLGLCGVQHQRAVTAMTELAERRGDSIVRSKAHPLLLTNLLWRTMYETPDGRIHVDALRIAWSGEVEDIEQRSRDAVRPKVPTDPTASDPREHDLAVFGWFSGDWLYLAPELQPAGSTDDIYCDARYSRSAAGFDGMFCLVLGPDGATEVLQRRPDDSEAAFDELLMLLRGKPE